MMRVASRAPLQHVHHHTLHRVVASRCLATSTPSPKPQPAPAADTTEEKSLPSYVNPSAVTESPFVPDFEPFRREKVYPHPRPYENKKIRNARWKENPLPKMSIREAVRFLRDNHNWRRNEDFILSFRMNIDIRKSNQLIRTSVDLPHGTGRNRKIAVFAEGEQAEAAREAGAEWVGTKDLAEFVKENKKIKHVLCTPSTLRYLGPYARDFGMRGLMPNVKAGTVITGDVKKAVENAKFRTVTLRTKDTPLMAVFVGKLSYPEEQIIENIVAVVDHLMQCIPEKIVAKRKATYIRSLYISTSQSRSVPIKTGEPPFIEPKTLYRGWGEIPARLIPKLEEQEKMRAFMAERAAAQQQQA